MSSFDELKDKLEQELEAMYREIQTAREEIKLQTNLLEREIRDEIDLLENKFEHYRRKLDRIKKEAELSNQAVLKDARALGEEILKAYRRIRNSFNR